MKLSDQCCTREQAQRLKELGAVQGERDEYRTVLEKASPITSDVWKVIQPVLQKYPKQ